MKLSKEDIEILTLEKKKRENDARYDPLPSCEERERLWKKSWNLMLKINALIYDVNGNYRKDKRHLLTGGSLDLSLLDNE